MRREIKLSAVLCAQEGVVIWVSLRSGQSGQEKNQRRKKKRRPERFDTAPHDGGAAEHRKPGYH